MRMYTRTTMVSLNGTLKMVYLLSALVSRHAFRCSPFLGISSFNLPLPLPPASLTPYPSASSLSSLPTYASPRPLHRSPSSPPAPVLPMPDPKNRHANRTNQPKQRINKINPHRMLHPDNPRVALRIRMNIHVSEQPEERDPEDEEERVGDEHEGDAREEGD